MKLIFVGLVCFGLSGCASLILGQINCNGQWVDCYDNCTCPKG